MPFEWAMVVGARHTGLSVKNIPVVHFQHLIDSMPQQIEAGLRAKWGATQYLAGFPNVL